MAKRATDAERNAARIMRYLGGARYRELARIFQRSPQCIKYWCDPEHRERKVVRNRLHRTPQEVNVRYKLRRQAKAQAADTGRPVQEIYREWGCL
jgi:transposase